MVDAVGACGGGGMSIGTGLLWLSSSRVYDGN